MSHPFSKKYKKVSNNRFKAFCSCETRQPTLMAENALQVGLSQIKCLVEMYESTMGAAIGDCTLFHNDERNYITHPELLDYWNQGGRSLKGRLIQWGSQ